MNDAKLREYKYLARKVRTIARHSPLRSDEPGRLCAAADAIDAMVAEVRRVEGERDKWRREAEWLSLNTPRTPVPVWFSGNRAPVHADRREVVSTYSAAVTMTLDCGPHGAFDVYRAEPDAVTVRDPRPVPPCAAEFRVTVGGESTVRNLWLPYGVTGERVGVEEAGDGTARREEVR